MTGDATGTSQECLNRASEVQHLASRVARCSEQVETVLARIRDIQLLEWQSPAGRAYRNSVALQEAALGKACERLTEARLAVGRHAREVAASAGSSAGWY
jgi:MarR-like DNA-binding transcriptional regulator SgrR of sgrS sRNA